jgi:peptide/nickel transport system permease protein
MRLSVSYIVKRVFMFFFIIWATASLNFLLPRLAPGDPISAMVSRMSKQGAITEGSEKLIAHYREVFGLGESLPVQYVRYLKEIVNFNLGYSLAYFPSGVMEIISRALPWTIGLLVTATLISFILGSLLGALIVWRPDERIASIVSTLLMVLSAIPYYLLAILLLYALAFGLHILPASGTAEIGSKSEFTFTYWTDVIRHSILPALSIILASLGGWVLSMRGLMVSVMGEDYLTLARAKGLPDRVIFLRYALRNAILPQVTILAIALGQVVSGAALVEIIYSYPGIGFQLYRSIGNADYTMIQGITFILVLTVATAVLILDLIYPRLDPRISYQRK